ncbi:MAG: translation initiation factor IF-2 [Pirellulales bacterium]|nr:translation initiation factor IF-2 [Pirellulales bacterium]
MPARIYTLAKELKIDSKELVEICAKAGIPDKGSALASLTDEEVTRLKEFLGGRASTGRAGPARSASASSGGGVAVAAPPDRLSREHYIPPAGVAGKPPVLTTPKKEKPPEAPRKPSEPRPSPKPTPTVRLAQLPPSSTKGPAKPLKPAEPAPQKPDLRLPADVLRASKSGAKPLAEHLKKTEDRRRAEEQQQKKTGGRTGTPSAAGRGPLGPLSPESREQRRRGGGGGKGAATGKGDLTGTLGGREARQLNRKRLGTDTSRRVSLDDDEGRRRKLRRAKKPPSTGKNTAAPRKGKIVVALPCNVRSFSESLGVPGQQVLGKLLQLGMAVSNLMAPLDHDTVDLLASEFGVEIEIRRAQTVDEQLDNLSNGQPEDESQLEPRPPVITFLGHVDHGKTSLLDKIIGIDVASGESGGITQHIRAYQIERDGRRIAFVDTPGHEAFTEMRARGANVTDIAVLVVAADDGVMPQTEEAISHAKAAGVPIVIALNKVDLPGVNYDRIYTQLVTAGLQPTEWGGDVELVKCSALTGQGIDELIETLMTIAELHELKANPHRKAIGTCLEAELHEGRGVVAKLLVQRGTLKVGDAVVCGMSSGHIKAMYDTLNGRKRLDAAGPSMPVNVTGLDIAPGAGDKFYAMDEIGAARDIAQRRLSQQRVAALGAAPVHVTLENLFDRLGKQEVQTLNIILRADVRGSIEAILKEFGKLEHPEVKIKVLQATVGGISEADVHLADASDAVIIGFNVVPDEKARALADQKGVQIRRYDIIYQVTDDLRKALEGLLKPEKREADLGRALVLRTFSISRLGTIAGCRVLSGTIQRNSRLRLIRESRVAGDYPLDSLRREKDDVKEVREGLECGIKLTGFNDLKEGDVLECYRIEEVARTL